MRAGLLGGLVAWLGFTLPSVIALVAFAFVLRGFDIAGAGWIHGLKIVAVAIVAQAVLGMGQKLTPDRGRVTLAAIGAAVVLSWHAAYSQILILMAAGMIGLWLYRKEPEKGTAELPIAISRTAGRISLPATEQHRPCLDRCSPLQATLGRWLREYRGP